MAYGIRKLSKVQLGRESTPGTAVAATEIWRGIAQMPSDMRTRVFVKEDLALRDPQNRFYDAAYLAQLAMPETEATFEQLPHILDAAINAATPTQDGTGPYVYAYVLNATSNSPKTYTIQGGDNTDVVRMEYSFVTQFSISGRVDEAIKVAATWLGRQVEDTSFTGSLSPIAVEEILFNKAKLYIDSTGGTIGTTEKAGSLLGFKLDVTTGWQATRGASGQLCFYGIKNVGGEATLELTLEHDSLAETERAAMRSGSVRLVRIQSNGTTVSGGSTWTSKALQINFEGIWTPESFRELQDSNGDNIVTGTLRHGRGSDNIGVQITAVNSRSSL